MSDVLFALREDAAESFADGAVSVPPEGRPFSIGDALREGRGVIETDDPQLIGALDAHEALKQVSAKEAAEIKKAAKSAPKDKDGDR